MRLVATLNGRRFKCHHAAPVTKLGAFFLRLLFARAIVSRVIQN
jgi:hypothetical protein